MSEGQTENNSISIKEFSGLPTEIQEYKYGDLVNRQNFSSLLAKSFLLSMGKAHVQYVYLEYLKNEIGFDWEGTLINFREAGGWNCLSLEEQDNFAEEFENIPTHKDNFKGEQFARLDKQLKSLVDPDFRERGLFKDTYNEFKLLNTMSKSEQELVRVFKKL